MSHADLLNLPKLMERLEDDRELLMEIFDVFIEETPARLERIDEAVRTHDLTAVVQWAHALKGTSGTLQAAPLNDICYKLEMAARAGDAPLAHSLVPAAVDLLDRTAAYIAELRSDMTS
ncbi:Hpt domain-containing protein [Fundidesulfovibrio soli]|uniref:Hpt domain-containing protein n=1 Tax=Fundidesulfovibrio soli TaxID=2922716 RepID=UPI001FAFC2DF|nr:Hpt domain-containing protein [Fundidesulfovibrio soli]